MLACNGSCVNGKAIFYCETLIAWRLFVFVFEFDLDLVGKGALLLLTFRMQMIRSEDLDISLLSLEILDPER